MIDFDEKDVVAVRRTADGERFALFTNTDVLPHYHQRFLGVVLDTGGDGFGVLVRYGSVATAPTGWTVLQLISVVQARLTEEHARAETSGALAVLDSLREAVANLPEVGLLGGEVIFDATGNIPASPYRWIDARCDDLSLTLCPDPESREEGVVPEQILIMVDQAMKDWTKREPHQRQLWSCRKAIGDALAAEVRRVRIVRGRIDPQNIG